MCKLIFVHIFHVLREKFLWNWYTKYISILYKGPHIFSVSITVLSILNINEMKFIFIMSDDGYFLSLFQYPVNFNFF